MMKMEKSSKAYKEIMRTLVNSTDDDTSPRKLFCQILNKTIGARDISKQECFHILHGLPIVEFTEGRQFISVNILRTRRLNLEGRDTCRSGVKDHSDHYWNRNNDPNYLRLLQYYQDHSEDSQLNNPENISLYQFAANYTMTWRLNKQNKVPHFTPNFFRTPKKLQNEERYILFLRTRLLEHKPGTTHDEIFSLTVEQLEDTMKAFVETNLCPHLIKEDFEESQTQNDETVNEPEELHPPLEPDTSAPEFEDWVECLQPPTAAGDAPQFNDAELEGEYDSVEIPQTDYDWNTPRLELGITNQELLNINNWMKETKLANQVDYPINQFSNIEMLFEEQFRAFAIVAEFIHRVQDNEDPEQLLLNVHGSAGTGKSTWLEKVVSYSNQLLGAGSIKTCAPSGTAANLISGYTIHSLLHIYPASHVPPLTGRPLADIQREFRRVKIIAIDEKSMIGQGILKLSDARLRQATGREDLPFGGISIILLGDWNQLPPVGDSPLYDSSKKVEVYRLYTLFNKVVIFNRLIRQGEDQQEFRQLLGRLSVGETTMEDWQRWRTRDLESLPTEEQEMFRRTALLACARKKDMLEHNRKKIIELNNPIAFIKSDSSPAIARLPAADEDCGLPPNILLSKGATIRLISNEWIEAGLTNGSQGTVLAIIYPHNVKPPQLPTAVICIFPGYSGPPYIENIPHSVAITPITRTWKNRGTLCSRTMLPIILAYALSIHRLQGKTCEKIILNPGPKEFSQGLLFVGASRVKNFTDLSFSPMPYFQRFSQVKHPPQKKKEMERLQMLNQQTAVEFQQVVRQFEDMFGITRNQ